MKLMANAFILLVSLILLSACGGASPDRVDLRKEQEARSYAVGAAALREVAQVIEMISEEYPDVAGQEKNELLHIGFVDMLNREPRVQTQMLELELMVRGLDDAAAMADLPAIKAFTFDDDEMTSQLYMLGAYLGMQVLLIDNMLQDFDKGLLGRVVAIGFWESLNEETRLDDDGITAQWEEIRRILTESVADSGEIRSENHARGLAYLEENLQREGVMVTPSGLQFEVLRAGEGASPSRTDIVEVHYAGTLVTGEQFDSSYERGETIRFPLDRVIPGWTEGLQLMQVGAKYRFVIPHELAYGDSQRGPMIEPYSVLVFEVELLDVIPARVD